MERQAAQSIIAFELEANCPESVDVERCARAIAEKLGDGFTPSYRRVRGIVREGLQDLEACLVESEMEELSSEIAELLCVDSDDADEDADFAELSDDESEED